MIRIRTISSFFLGRIVFSVCFAMLLPAAAHAACSRWDISGEWTAVQTNDTKPSFALQQAGSEIHGSGHWARVITYNTFPARGDDYVEADASVDGTIKGDTVEFTAYWSNDTIGVYSGEIGPQGRIQGTTYDKSHPESRANWYSDRTVQCLAGGGDSSAENAAPAAPTKALGRVLGTTPALALQRVGDEPMICAQARSARARNSPVAAQLEAQCQKAGGNFTDRAMTQAPSYTQARNTAVLSHTGIVVPQTVPPSAAAPPPQAPRMPGDRPMPGEQFTPPLFDDGAQLWACADASQDAKKGGACNGIKAAKQYCRARGYSGVLQQHRDGSPALTLAPPRAGIPVRAVNGDVCVADKCVGVRELDCAP